MAAGGTYNNHLKSVLKETAAAVAAEVEAAMSAVAMLIIFFFNSDVAFYIGIIQTSFMMKFPKSNGGTGIVIPVKNTPQEQIKQESVNQEDSYSTR